MKPENGYDQRLSVLGIGLGGCHGETVDGGHITYYDTRLRAYLGELVEGGYVIDKSKPLAERPSLAYMSPMCKGALPSGTTEEFHIAPDNFVANAIANESGNPAAGIARMMLAIPRCGAFDYVAPDVYAAWWMRQGARVGQRKGDSIVWSDGSQEAIPEFSNRYQEVQS
jgi:hypothetical protein